MQERSEQRVRARLSLWRTAATHVARALPSLVAALALAGLSRAQTPAFVQGRYATPQTPQTAVALAYASAQTAGNLNVVAIAWDNATTQVVSVSDSRGNVYALAAGPTVQAGIQSQAIYYAANIASAAANANSVSVTFSAAAPYPDLRIAEYSGMATSSALLAGVGASGSGNQANSGNVSVASVPALLVGAGYTQSHFNGAGTGFTQRLLTVPDGSLLEDRVVTTAGSYAGTGPTAGSRWVMQVAAFRAGGASGGDTQAPTAPGGLSATAVSGAQINLSWTASTDNVGVTGYRVERCQGAGCSSFAQIATPTGTTYSNTGLTPATSYSYRVRATDAAGNFSGYSATATASTPDTLAPTAPGGLGATAASSAQIDLSWTASTDNVAVTGYRVERCQGTGCSSFAQIATPTATSYSDTGLSPATTYRYRVRAADGAGNLGGYSSIAAATTATVPDTQPPTVPGGLAAAAASGTQINLSWTASTDNVAVTGYRVERCQGAGCSSFAQIATPTTTSYADGGLVPATSYTYRVRAVDAAGNPSDYSGTASATTPDTQPPTAPGGLGATASSGTQIDLSWTASTDNVGVTGYRVERCQGAGCSSFTQVATPTATSHSDAGLAPGTSYTYRVRAVDAAGNPSAYSGTASATTPDTQPPTDPGGLSATAVSSTQINLSWTASTDNVGVTGYRVERCQDAGCSSFAQIATPTTTSYADGGLVSATSYTYRVRAVDAAGNTSGYSATASATTALADAQPPSDPTGLGAAPISGTQVNLSWTASTDNVGVTGYRIERCQGAGCSSFAQIATPAAASYSDTGLTPATSYTYRVRAVDAAGNVSGYSATATASTPDTQAPTAPSGLGATVVSSVQINLSWTASTDNVGVTGYRVERCQGAGCSSFAQIATSTATSYSDPGLSAGTSYSYRVRAADAAGNLSAYSATASATSSGGTPANPAYVQGRYATPQTPQTAVALAYASAQTAGNLNVVAIAWNDATTQVVSVSDSRGNVYALAAGPTVQAGIQSQAIYYAANIASAAANANSVSVTFSAAAPYADLRIAEYSGMATSSALLAGTGASGSGNTANSGNVNVASVPALLVGAGYTQSHFNGAGTSFTQRLLTVPDGSLLEDRVVTTAGSYAGTGPTAGSGWVMQVAAFRAGSASGGDTQAPTAPGGLSATAVSGAQIDLSWTASTDNVAVTGYRVERCQGAGCSSFAQIATPTGTTYSDTGLTPAISYTYRVRATDAAGNLGAYSGTASATTTTAPDTQPPTAPGSLSATAASSTRIDLSWTASSDDFGVTGYRVERCQDAGCSSFAQIATPTATSYSDTGLTPSTAYAYRVRAADAAGNLSAYSGTTAAVTLAPPDTTPPQIQIDSPASGAQLNDIVTITATASDDVGVVGVQFYVDGSAFGPEDDQAPYGVNWDTRTTSNGAHTLTARARDAAGNAASAPYVIVNVANTSQFVNEILATGFALPTNIEFLPDGRMLVAELAGTIRVLPPPYTTPDPTPFLQLNLNIPGYAGLQQGIFDIMLDPAFATNHYYYVFYTKDSPNRDRLSRFTANAALDGTLPGSEVILYQDPQVPDTEHHGGAINFGNDGKIYFTTGEHFYAPNAQDLTNPRGKVHRINPDGSIPTDGPFYDGTGPNWDSIWAYGLRNPFRAYYDAPTGRLYVADVGGNDYSTAQEEVNLIVAGKNYGWPNCELGTCGNPAYTPALYAYAHNGRDASITGGFVYHGSAFPSAYQGSYFFADYTQNWIRRLTFDAQGNVLGVFNFEPADGSVDGPYGDIVYLTEGPDGALYYVDLGYSDLNGGTFGVSKIRRIRYVQSNLPPTSIASANPVSGQPPLTVTFSSAGSVDPEGQPLSYAWTFGDGTSSTEANPVHTYTLPGPYSVRLSVSDGVNSALSPPLVISVGNAPVPTIFAPIANSSFVAGDVIAYSGDATDQEDGQLPASAFLWNVDFLHEGHVHPGSVQSGVKSGTFTIPSSGHDFSGNTRYRVTLTVTDSAGLQTSVSTLVYPQKVNLSFDAVPSGLTLYLDGIAKATPFVYDTLVGFQHTVEARDVTTPSATYTFASWSDGGTQTHTITAPATASSYVATYGATTLTTFGETGILPEDDSGNANLLVVQDAILPQPASLQSLSFHVTAVSGSLRLGIYDATGPGGGPGALRAQTNAFTPVIGWNRVPVLTPVSLAAGSYWLAYLPSSNSLHFAANRSIGAYRYANLTFGAMPATFPAIAGQGVTHWSLFGTATLSGGAP